MQDDSRIDASFIAIIVIGIGSSGIDPSSFPCILATCYRFVGTLLQSHTDLYHDRYDYAKGRRNNYE